MFSCFVLTDAWLSESGTQSTCNDHNHNLRSRFRELAKKFFHLKIAVTKAQISTLEIIRAFMLGDRSRMFWQQKKDITSQCHPYTNVKRCNKKFHIINSLSFCSVSFCANICKQSEQISLLHCLKSGVSSHSRNIRVTSGHLWDGQSAVGSHWLAFLELHQLYFYPVLSLKQ